MQFFPDYLQLHSNSHSELSHAVAWLGGYPVQSGCGFFGFVFSFLNTHIQL